MLHFWYFVLRKTKIYKIFGGKKMSAINRNDTEDFLGFDIFILLIFLS